MEVHMDSSSIQEAEARVAELQAALDDAQRVLQATEKAQLAAERAHEAAERHAQSLRIVSLMALGLVVIALVGRRRHRH
jgi:hypothetical protein